MSRLPHPHYSLIFSPYHLHFPNYSLTHESSPIVGSSLMIASFHNLASANAASSSHELIQLECKGDWFDRCILFLFPLWNYSISVSFSRYMHHTLLLPLIFHPSLFVFHPFHHSLSLTSRPSFPILHPVHLSSCSPPSHRLLLSELRYRTALKSHPSSLSSCPTDPQHNSPRHRTRRRPDLKKDSKYERGHQGAADCAFIWFYFVFVSTGSFGVEGLRSCVFRSGFPDCFRLILLAWFLLVFPSIFLGWWSGQDRA